jgi:hypothetical protein
MYNNQNMWVLVSWYAILSCSAIKSSEKPNTRFESRGTLHRCLNDERLPWFAHAMGKYLAKNAAGARIGGETEQRYTQNMPEICKKYAVGEVDCSHYTRKILFALQQCRDVAPKPLEQ